MPTFAPSSSSTADPTPAIPDLVARARATGQADLAEALERASGPAAARLAADVAALDLELIADLVARFAGDDEAAAGIGAIGPADAIPLPRDDADRQALAAARERGELMLREDRVAVVLLAGGQGTRLGFDGPKGDFPFAPISGRTLFAHHAAKIAAIRARYGCRLPWYVLTSPQNDAVTKQSFAGADHFGLDPASVRFVVQGTLPAVDRATGQVLREAADRIARSPDGHGGLLSALRRSGALAEMRAAGITTVFTFQVDNPLARVARPELLGFHELAGAEMSSVAVRKVAAGEKMGVIASVGGRTGVVEYSDLPDDLAGWRDDEGELVLWAGSIAVHCINVEFIERLTADGLALPYHRAVKKVPYVDAADRLVSPDEPNGIKFETFLFDALTSAEASVTLEAAREDEFAPIKNGEGADSPATARALLNDAYARWLEAAGVVVPRDAAGAPVDLEIDPRLALDADELAARLPAGFTLSGPAILGPELAG